MSININKLETLSKISIKDEDRDYIQNKLNCIIELMDELSKDCDLSEFDNIKPDKFINLREDSIDNKFSRDELLSNCNYKQAGCVVVPKVIE